MVAHSIASQYHSDLQADIQRLCDALEGFDDQVQEVRYKHDLPAHRTDDECLADGLQRRFRDAQRSLSDAANLLEEVLKYFDPPEPECECNQCAHNRAVC